jgi:nitroreductase
MADAFGTVEDESTSYERLVALVRSRRTSMFVDPDREVPAELVAELCGLATWAPNHKKTWPWRFALFTGDGRGRLGRTMVQDMIDTDFGDEGKRAKTRTKYERTPAVLVVGCAPHHDELLDRENRDAVAAGIQNLLLGATALGLASFWSSPALTHPPRVLELCGFDATDRVVGMIYLGWAVGDCPVPERPILPITHVTG